MARLRKRWIAIVWLSAAVLAAALLYAWQGDNTLAWIASGFSENTPPALFLLMFLVLPLIGFPISVFLVLIGVKFGSLWGVLILFVGIAAHLLASYRIANSFLHGPIERGLVDLGYRLPQVPPHRVLWFSSLFMVVPGLPYTVKNYALALCGVPFTVYFFSGFVFQGAMGVPFVVLGDALATEQLILLVVVVGASAGLIAALQWLKKRYAQRSDRSPESKPRSRG